MIQTYPDFLTKEECNNFISISLTVFLEKIHDGKMKYKRLE